MSAFVKNDVLKQHAKILKMGTSQVVPAAGGKPWLIYLLAVAVVTTFLAWSSAKVKDELAISRAQDKVIAQVASAKETAFVNSINQREKGLADYWLQITNAVTALQQRAQTEQAIAQVLAKHPAPIAFNERPWVFDRAAAKAEYDASGTLATIDAEETRARAVMDLGATWVNETNSVLRSLRWAGVPDWYSAKYATGKEAELDLMEQVPAQEPTPVVNGGPPTAPRYVPEAEQASAPAAPVIAPPPAPVVKPAPKPPAPRTSDGRTPVTDW